MASWEASGIIDGYHFFLLNEHAIFCFSIYLKLLISANYKFCANKVVFYVLYLLIFSLACSFCNFI